jgi:hypothetical protein
MTGGREQQIAGAAERRQRAERRAAEAQRRAAEARERMHELAAGNAERTLAQLRKSAMRQALRAQAALRYAGEGHDRAARVFEDAARLQEERGDRSAAAEHRDRAKRCRSEARAGRASHLERLE